MKTADLDERILSVDAQVMLPPHMTGSGLDFAAISGTS